MKPTASLLILSATALSSALTIHDETFSNSVWDFSYTGTNVASASVSQLVGGGVTGSAQRTTVNKFSFSASMTYAADHIKLDQSLNPSSLSVTGPIAWELWYRVGGTSTYGTTELIASQGSGYYIAGSTYREPQNFSTNWQRSSGSLSIGDFSLYRGSGPAALDLSVGAAPIRFGYRNFSDVSLAVPQVNYDASFFDMNIPTQPVPEPASLAAVALGLAGLLGRRRERQGILMP